ncbi:MULTISPECIES: hypothetical protein [unclassified Anabaena]|uniref:hypothetical protein n=1 Tax=unclassified Anabaena TaxID=2619674 RepID=UPI001681E205|nr:hypothetical protein [Anabaena sp. UHCC 0399]MBD2364329.1 hypothetical protein [Anabaena minutissima FACHB-250]MEA5567350.1 hypothetical protein [Anabaena sp. UHCC 0399]
MKNIQVIDGARNCAYDIFAATDEEFKLIFPDEGQDIQFDEDIYSDKEAQLGLAQIWQRRLDKKSVNGIHGTLFYQLKHKKQFYPNKREEDLTINRGRA